MLKVMGPYGRYVDPFEKNSLSMFIQELYSRDQLFIRDSMGGFWGFWEFGAYIGVFFTGMAVVGILFRFAQALPWLVAALVFSHSPRETTEPIRPGSCCIGFRCFRDSMLRLECSCC